MTCKNVELFPNKFLAAFASCLTSGGHSFMSCFDAEYHATREMGKRLSSIGFGFISVCSLLLHSDSLESRVEAFHY